MFVTNSGFYLDLVILEIRAPKALNTLPRTHHSTHSSMFSGL